MTQELAGGAATPAIEANPSDSDTARALYVGLRVSAHSLKAGSNYNGRPGVIIADLLPTPPTKPTRLAST